MIHGLGSRRPWIITEFNTFSWLIKFRVIFIVLTNFETDWKDREWALGKFRVMIHRGLNLFFTHPTRYSFFTLQGSRVEFFLIYSFWLKAFESKGIYKKNSTRKTCQDKIRYDRVIWFTMVRTYFFLITPLLNARQETLHRPSCHDTLVFPIVQKTSRTLFFHSLKLR